MTLEDEAVFVLAERPEGVGEPNARIELGVAGQPLLEPAVRAVSLPTATKGEAPVLAWGAWW